MPGQIIYGNISNNQFYREYIIKPEFIQGRKGVGVTLLSVQPSAANQSTSLCIYMNVGASPNPLKDANGLIYDFDTYQEYFCFQNRLNEVTGGRWPVQLYVQAENEAVHIAVVDLRNLVDSFRMQFQVGEAACREIPKTKDTAAIERFQLPFCQDAWSRVSSTSSAYKIATRALFHRTPTDFDKLVNNLNTFKECGTNFKTYLCSQNYAPCDSNGIPQKICYRACDDVCKLCRGLLVGTNFNCTTNTNNEVKADDNDCFYFAASSNALSALFYTFLVVLIVLALCVLFCFIYGFFWTLCFTCLFKMFCSPKKSNQYNLLDNFQDADEFNAKQLQQFELQTRKPSPEVLDLLEKKKQRKQSQINNNNNNNNNSAKSIQDAAGETKFGELPQDILHDEEDSEKYEATLQDEYEPMKETPNLEIDHSNNNNEELNVKNKRFVLDEEKKPEDDEEGEEGVDVEHFSSTDDDDDDKGGSTKKDDEDFDFDK